MITDACIIAGGAGTRLVAVEGDVPKSLVRVNGKPVLQHQLELAVAHGVRSVRIFAGYLAGQIVDWTACNPVAGLDILVSIETKPMGSAGALLENLQELKEHFLVFYGDVMASINLGKLGDAHLARGADFTAVIHPNDHPSDSDLVEIDGEGWIRKLYPYPHPEGAVLPNLVSAALYAVRRDSLLVFSGGSDKKDFIKDIIPGLMNREAKVLGYCSREYLMDMGTPERLKKVRADWDSGRITSASESALEPAVFVDRDGTLNRLRGYVTRPSDLVLIEGAGEALKRLRGAGFRIVVLTNQPVISRGEVSEKGLRQIHRKLEWDLGLQGAFVDAIYHCPHHPNSGFPGERPDLKFVCRCRKPATGLLDQAVSELNLDRNRSWVIGDTTRDVELARRAGLRSILVGTGEAGKDGRFPDAEPTHCAKDLRNAAVWLESRLNAGSGS